jgi:alkylated DNA repair dioxygenase AlkB
MAYYEHFPSFLEASGDETYFERLYKEMTGRCIRFPIKMYGKTFMSSRRSCVFSDSVEYHNYREIPNVKWSKSRLMRKLRRMVSEKLKVDFDYVLVHIYEDGRDYIGYHNDSEALDSTVASLSFGATRKFRFRKIVDEEGNKITKGWDDEFELGDGDLFVMWGPLYIIKNKKKVKICEGCQEIYKHSIPKQLRIKKPRINLTFRQRLYSRK